jgi:WD40 repeat protein
VVQHEDESKFNGSGTESIAFSSAERIFAIGERYLNPKIHIYDFEYNRIQVLTNGTKISYSSLNFSRDGLWLVSLGSIPDHKIIVWNWKTGEK